MKVNRDVGFTHNVVVIHNNHALVRVTVSGFTFPNLEITSFGHFNPTRLGNLVLRPAPMNVFLVVVFHGALDNDIGSRNHGGGTSHGYCDLPFLLQLNVLRGIHLNVWIFWRRGWTGCSLAHLSYRRLFTWARFLFCNVDHSAWCDDLLTEDHSGLNSLSARCGTLKSKQIAGFTPRFHWICALWVQMANCAWIMHPTLQKENVGCRNENWSLQWNQIVLWMCSRG